MALFKYGFKRMRDEAVLPDPHGEFNRILAPSAIEEANNEVKDVCVPVIGVIRFARALQHFSINRFPCFFIHVETPNTAFSCPYSTIRVSRICH